MGGCVEIMSISAGAQNAMSGLWEQEGKVENLEAYLKAQGKGMGKRYLEGRTHDRNRTTLSIFFPDANTVQSLFTVGETKKIEPNTAMLNMPLPIIDPHERTMIQVTLETN